MGVSREENSISLIDLGDIPLSGKLNNYFLFKWKANLYKFEHSISVLLGHSWFNLK